MAALSVKIRSQMNATQLSIWERESGSSEEYKEACQLVKSEMADWTVRGEGGVARI